jgi:aspartate-semialdehyde dehydrogenase
MRADYTPLSGTIPRREVRSRYRGRNGRGRSGTAAGAGGAPIPRAQSAPVGVGTVSGYGTALLRRARACGGLQPDSFHGIDIAFFSAGSARSKEFAPLAVQAGAVVIDNSSAFRMQPEVPLVIPEINPDAIATHKGIIANPNCSTIILLMALEPLRRLSRIRRIVVSTYQAASGAGARAMQELLDATRAYLSGEPYTPTVLPHPYAFNLFSHDSAIGEDGYNEEERKMILETRKIWGDPEVAVSPTCVRVPVLRAHSESIVAELEARPPLEAIYEAYRAFEGVQLVDDRTRNHFPMPIEATGRDEVLVGRIRYDAGTPNGVALFACGDQLRKGAALNAVQIAERL